MPPELGRPLPRAADAYAEPDKLSWIVAEHGHGPEFAHVLHVTSDQVAELFAAIKSAVQTAPVVSLRLRDQHGIVCGVDVNITLNARTSRVRTSWHYREDAATPRLVTAFPTT